MKVKIGASEYNYFEAEDYERRMAKNGAGRWKWRLPTVEEAKKVIARKYKTIAMKVFNSDVWFWCKSDINDNFGVMVSFVTGQEYIVPLEKRDGAKVILISENNC